VLNSSTHHTAHEVINGQEVVKTILPTEYLRYSAYIQHFSNGTGWALPGLSCSV